MHDSGGADMMGVGMLINSAVAMSLSSPSLVSSAATDLSDLYRFRSVDSIFGLGTALHSVFVTTSTSETLHHYPEGHEVTRSKTPNDVAVLILRVLRGSCLCPSGFYLSKSSVPAASPLDASVPRTL